MKLTPREDQVARLVGQGLSYKAIGGRIGCSGRTAKAHVHAIADKLGRDTMPAKIRVQMWASEYYEHQPTGAR